MAQQQRNRIIAQLFLFCQRTACKQAVGSAWQAFQAAYSPNQGSPKTSLHPIPRKPTMQTQTLTIINKLGLHARASSKFVQTAAQYQSEIWVSKGEKRINGKSIMGLMMLAAAQGSTIQIEANGADEAQAIQALAALINDYFGEGE